MAGPGRAVGLPPPGPGQAAAIAMQHQSGGGTSTPALDLARLIHDAEVCVVLVVVGVSFVDFCFWVCVGIIDLEYSLLEHAVTLTMIGRRVFIAIFGKVQDSMTSCKACTYAGGEM